MSYQYFERIEDLYWILPLALLHGLLFFQLWWWQRKQFDGALMKRFGPALAWWRLALKWALWTLAAVLLVYALAVPLGPPIKVSGEQSGADIILVVDVSSSMHAQDIAPDRLEALKKALVGFVERLNGDRVGLVAFAGEAVVACPLTSDVETLTLFLSKLDTDSVPRDGTGLGPALKLALDGFQPDPQRGRLIMLATDGEDTAASNVLEQAKRAASAGIPVFTLGIGTPGGALIPGQRDLFGRVYAKTYQGQPVRTKLDSSTLKKIAAITNAQYFEGASGAGLSKAYESLRSLKQGLAKAQDTYTREPLYQKPLLWAFWLLVLEALISARSGSLLKVWQKGQRLFAQSTQTSGVVKRLVVVLALIPTLAHAFTWGDPGRTDYNLGNQAFRAGNIEEAAQAYARSLVKNPDKPDALYNLGLAFENAGDPVSALEAYQQASLFDPEDAKLKTALLRAQKKADALPKKKGAGGNGVEEGGSFKDKIESLANGGGLGRKSPNSSGDNEGEEEAASPEGPDKRAGTPDAEGSPRRGQDMEDAAGRGRNGKIVKSKDGMGMTSQRAAKAQQSLNQDQVQAMMNQLRLDQKRYAGAFNPMKKHDQKPLTQQEQMEEMMRQQMGLPPKAQAQEAQGGAERKDW